ncbi:membrane protein [Aliidongia dinghuensis]|uniref:Membrane protein n=1 Tax=Aliidongia dinghuensis TaxID=1867774 RepID=A0A8J3E6P6_9PROT|nr:hypothetical protein [Aliidongia dinghuensis]GGF46764.1 membrane protein [Aliidongia dinghuensis]
MPARAWLLFKALLILFAIAAPFVTHFILATGDWGMATYLLIAGQALLALWAIGMATRRAWARLAGALILAGGLALGVLHPRGGFVLLTGLPHALIYLGLLMFFGMSLRPGQVPLVTRLSHQIHGTLPPAIDRYTRRVTWAWCLFFLGQLLGSALLLWLAPIAWWSAFVNILNAPLLTAMFLGEKMTRSFWVTNPPREHLRDIVRMIVMVKAQMARRDRGCPRPRET